MIEQDSVRTSLQREMRSLTASLSALLLIACNASPLATGDANRPSSPAAPDLVPGPVLVVVQPSEVWLGSGEAIEFRASFRTEMGTTVTDTAEWSADGGTIDADGRYVAGTAYGQYRVIVRRKNGKQKGQELADTATVHVDEVLPPEPVTLSVSPASIQLQTEEQARFSAVLLDSAGHPTQGGVTWTAAGGSIDGSGLFTAGSAPGQFEITAASQNGLTGRATASIALPLNERPTAVISAECVQLDCTFDGSGSRDPDGSIAGYEWEFGDGSAGTGERVLHSYPGEGSYSVRLTVLDDRGDTASIARTIAVSGAGMPSGVSIYPGESIQSAVNSNPAGTTFIIRAGVHRRQQVTPKDDMRFIGEPGAILDGEDVTPYAFGSYGIPGRNVLIERLTIERYAPQELYQGAILGDNAQNWTVRDNVVRRILGVGIRLGPGMHVVGNEAVDNANLGIGGFNPHGAVVEDNEVSGNGFDGRSGEHAGIKVVAGRDLVFRNNVVHDNVGRGIWLDTDIFDAVVDGNYVHDNSHEGIWLEVVCGATVKGNRAERNGLAGRLQSHWPDWAGIQVVNGTDVEIYENKVADNLNGIALLAATGYPTHACVPDLRNVYVHHNEITMSQGLTGLAENFGSDSYFDSRGNRFDDNAYGLGSEEDYFLWKGARLNESEWRSAGQDVNGSFAR